MKYIKFCATVRRVKSMYLHVFVFILMVLFFDSQLMADMKTDSLLLELRSSDQNKERTLTLNELSKKFTQSNLDSSIYYAKSGLGLASEINYSLGIAENAASLGDYYIIYDSLNKAEKYYILAGKYFDELDMDYNLAQLYQVLGNIYLSQSNLSEALMYYQESQIISEENNFIDILPSIHNNVGLIYSQLGENDKALEHLMKAYDGFKVSGINENVAHSVSNIAVIYLKEAQDSLAISYFKEAIKIYEDFGNLIDASSILMTLGDYEFNKGNLNKALYYYEDGYKQALSQSVEYLGPRSRVISGLLAGMGRIHYHLGNKQKAIEYLEESLVLATQNSYINRIEFSTEILSEIYESDGDFSKALSFYKIHEQYGDSILNEGSIKKITQLEMQFEFDKKMKEKELDDIIKENAQQRKELIYLILISIGVFAAIIAILLYLMQKSKTAKIELKRRNLNLEHERLQQELDYKNKELATNVLYLLRKNEFITATAEQLKKAKLNFKMENQKIIQDIIRDLLLNSSKDIWEEFEVRFQDVHSEFYDNLNKRFPDLTPNEKKICSFLRLNMSTKEISAITYQSVRSIDMARFRLRKKIGLDSEENLISFLSNI